MGELYLRTACLLQIEEDPNLGTWYLRFLVTEPTFRRQGGSVEHICNFPDLLKNKMNPSLGLNCDERKWQLNNYNEKNGLSRKLGEASDKRKRYHHMQYTLK